MKVVALSFLLGATVVFLLCTWAQADGAAAWVGYVRAGAEAGMVGALADWFAVTALFRRPLGLPIPHTAIIPNKKDMIGDSLGDFIGTNFLAEDVVRDKLRRTELARRVGGWLAEPVNAERVTAELATAARGVVTVLRDEDVQEVLEQVVVRQLMSQQWGPPLGRVLSGVLSDGAHLHPREAVQHLIQAILEATEGTLADDATALCLDWHGGPVRERTSESGADR